MSEFVEYINSVLKPSKESKYRAIDLFAGCGGLALGFEAVGIKTTGYEMVKDFCDAYSKNLDSTCVQQKLTKDSTYPSCDLLIGGPPCQPFSVGGKQLGLKDSRDGFPAYIEAVRKLKPRLFIFENVRGLLYRNKWYLDEVIGALENEGYIIEKHLVNVVDYGVPQNRERLIVIGHKGKFNFPKPTKVRVPSGSAIGDIYDKPLDNWKYLTKSQDEYIAKYEKASKCKNPRDLDLNKPARTLTVRNLAGATGDMHRVKLADGTRRRITVREAARLQSFPDWFNFSGTETSQFTQIGNAVPPLFAYQLAKSVLEYLEAGVELSSDEVRREQIIMKEPPLFQNL